MRHSTSSMGVDFGSAPAAGERLRMLYDADSGHLYFGKATPATGECSWFTDSPAFADASPNGGRNFFVNVNGDSGTTFSLFSAAGETVCPASPP